MGVALCRRVSVGEVAAKVSGHVAVGDARVPSGVGGGGEGEDDVMATHLVLSLVDTVRLLEGKGNEVYLGWELRTFMWKMTYIYVKK